MEHSLQINYNKKPIMNENRLVAIVSIPDSIKYYMEGFSSEYIYACLLSQGFILETKKACTFLSDYMVGTKTMSLQKLSLPSLTLCPSLPSTPVHNSCGLLLLMGCLHYCLTPSADWEACIGWPPSHPGSGGRGTFSISVHLWPTWARAQSK